MLKHKLTLLLSLGLIVAASVLAINSHRDYIHHLTIQQAMTAAQHARQAAIEQAQAAAHLKDLENGCQQGLLAYQLLTPTQRSHVVKPECTLK